MSVVSAHCPTKIASFSEMLVDFGTIISAKITASKPCCFSIFQTPAAANALASSIFTKQSTRALPPTDVSVCIFLFLSLNDTSHSTFNNCSLFKPCNPVFQVEVGASGSDHGSTLIISLAKDEDGGQYVCEMGTGGGEAIKHTVHIRGEFSLFGGKF